MGVRRLHRVSFFLLSVLAASAAKAQCPQPTLTPDSWGSSSGNFSTGSGLVTLSGTGQYATTQMFENAEAAYVTLAGDGQIQAQLQSVSGLVGANTVAGIFIRGGTSAGSDGGLLWVRGTALTTAQFADRTNDGPLTLLESKTISASPSWLQLQNRGKVLYPSVSTDGINWTPMPTPAYDLSGDVSFFEGPNYVYGLIVWSGSNSSPTTAVFGNVCVSLLSTGTPTVTPSSTVSPTPSSTPTFTWTRTPSSTPTQTPTSSPSATPSSTSSPSPTRTTTSTPTLSPTSTVTATPSPTRTPLPTFTPTATTPPCGSPGSGCTPSPTPGHFVWPNPFTPQQPPNNFVHFNLPPGHGAGQLVIADLRRRKVRSLGFGAGADVEWDGRDDGGNLVSSGLYLYLLQSDGTVRRGTVTVMR